MLKNTCQWNYFYLAQGSVEGHRRTPDHADTPNLLRRNRNHLLVVIVEDTAHGVEERLLEVVDIRLLYMEGGGGASPPFFQGSSNTT